MRQDNHEFILELLVRGYRDKNWKYIGHAIDNLISESKLSKKDKKKTRKNLETMQNNIHHLNNKLKGF